jgi:hypothetical protein
VPNYQPFLISEFKTGLFNYLQPWIRPIEAFEPLDNAYIYRGVLTKRNGYTFFGYMAYEDVLAVGNGSIVTFTGTLAFNGSGNTIVPGSFTPTDGTEHFTDNGAGVLTGSAGGTGTINYTTGAYSITFNAAPGSGVLILGPYYDLPADGARPIMGLKQWVNETTGQGFLVALDTRRAALYNNTTQVFDPIDTVDQVVLQPQNLTGSAVPDVYTISTGWAAVSPYTTGLAPFSISITDNTTTITDNGSGGFTGYGGNFVSPSTINYATGVLGLNYSVPANTPAGKITITLTATLTGDYFSGGPSNFFNATNWQGLLWLTNNVDRITTFDGTSLARPAFPITQEHQLDGINDIATCLDVDVYKNRFLVQRPTLVGQTVPAGQSIRYSAIQVPTNLVADVPGNGGELSAPTDDFIQSSEFLRDAFIVFFTNTTWTFRFTGSSFDPFRWDKINVTKSTSAPYATIPYDERLTAMGSKGLIACDGVNVQRYDLEIIDLFNSISQKGFPQCYGVRVDTLNQSWMLYPDAPDHPVDDQILSDRVLVYNFLENAWSTYSLAMSCLGLFYAVTDVTWNDFAPGGSMYLRGYTDWNACSFPWNFYLLQSLAPDLLGGGQDGIVYLMDTGNTDKSGFGATPDGTPIEATISTTQWNPFSKLGQKVQFGYIDFYYIKNPEVVLDITFQVDNLESTFEGQTRQITLDGPGNSNKGMKRVYLNAMGEFIQMNITSNSPGQFEILGLVLWARPAGRLTP